MTRNKSFNNGPLLYLVATPIGNLKEISKRALDVFMNSDIIAAEDTRNTYSLLSNYGIKKELFSLREHNEVEASKHLLNKIKEGKKVLLCASTHVAIDNVLEKIITHKDSDKLLSMINPVRVGDESNVYSECVKPFIYSNIMGSDHCPIGIIVKE